MSPHDPLRLTGSFLEDAGSRRRLRQGGPLSSSSEPSCAQRPPRASRRKPLGSRSRCLLETCLRLEVELPRSAAPNMRRHFLSQCKVEEEGFDHPLLLTQQRPLQGIGVSTPSQTYREGFPA